MVKITQVINKETKKPYVTKEGSELKNYFFEVGDEFIPQINKIIENSKIVNIDGEEEEIINYSVPVKVRDVNNIIGSNETIFINLTPNQARFLKDKIKGIKRLEKDKIENVDPFNITQLIFSCYEYELRKKKYVGIGLKKDFVEAKSFEDFDNTEDEDKNE
jgi:hypothetical protein